MTGIDHYMAEFVESFPKALVPGLLYVSPTYATAAHVCPCGCGQRVVTKLSPARWRVIFDGEVSVRPSIASTGLSCNSHYFITRGTVEWGDKLDDLQVSRGRQRDQEAVEARRVPAGRSSWAARLRQRIRRSSR